MNSKLVVLIVVILTLLILAFAWFYLKDVMLDYDVDPDTSQPILSENHSNFFT